MERGMGSVHNFLLSNKTKIAIWDQIPLKFYTYCPGWGHHFQQGASRWTKYLVGCIQVSGRMQIWLGADQNPIVLVWSGFKKIHLSLSGLHQVIGLNKFSHS